jgi:uncharacterized protein YcfL
VVAQLRVVLRVGVRGHEQGEVAHEQKLNLQTVDLVARNTADLGVISVVEILQMGEEEGEKRGK